MSAVREKSIQQNERDRAAVRTEPPTATAQTETPTAVRQNGSPGAATQKKQWTFMVYIAGDNNLDPAALLDIAEMAKAGSSKELNIIVQLDRADDRKTRRFYITRGGGYEKDCIETFGETNTGDPAILEGFIRWGMERYPAERYALVVWNHGGGWWDEAARAKRNIAYDDSSEGDALNNRELQDVLAKTAGIRGARIDVLGMDACLMAMIEVAYQLRNSVEVMVSSEEEEPFEGWPYGQILEILKNRPGLSAATIGKNIVREYIESYRDRGEAVTQSAFNLLKIAEPVSRLDALSGELIARLDDDPFAARKNGSMESRLMQSIDAARESSPRFFMDNYVDLYRFAQLLEKKCRIDGIKEKAGDLLRSLKPGSGRAIIRRCHIGRRLRHSHGMSVYFPAAQINPQYQKLDFYRDCRWGEFLERYIRVKNGSKE